MLGNTDTVPMPDPTNRDRDVKFNDPELGHLQTIILKIVIDLGNEAYGFRILEVFKQRLGRTDHSQVYAGIKKLLKRGLIRRTGNQRSVRGGPPAKLLTATSKGLLTANSVLAHHKAMVAFLTNQE